MTGNPGAIQAFAAKLEAKARTNTANLDTFSDLAATARAGSSSPAITAFAGSVSSFVGEAAGIATALTTGANALHAAAGVLPAARNRVVSTRSRFLSDAAAAQAKHAKTIKGLGTVPNARAVSQKADSDLVHEIERLGEKARGEAKEVEADLNHVLFNVANTLRGAGVSTDLSRFARQFRSDYGGVSWGPSRSMLSLFGLGRPRPYDQGISLSVPGQDVAFALSGMPFVTTENFTHWLSDGVTPGAALRRSLQSLLVTTPTDLIIIGGFSPENTKLFYSDNTTVNDVAALGVDSVISYSLEKGGWFVSDVLRKGRFFTYRGEIYLYSGIPPVAIGFMPGATKGFTMVSDALVPEAKSTDPNNNAYWRNVLADSAAVGLGVSVPDAAFRYASIFAEDAANPFTKANLWTTAVLFASPSMQNYLSTVGFGPEPPHPHDPFFTTQRGAIQAVGGFFGEADHLLRSGTPAPSDIPGVNYIRGSVNLAHTMVNDFLELPSDAPLDRARTAFSSALFDVQTHPSDRFDSAVGNALMGAAGAIAVPPWEQSALDVPGQQPPQGFWGKAFEHPFHRAFGFPVPAPPSPVDQPVYAGYEPPPPDAPLDPPPPPRRPR
ncbi:MAG: WXG100 family type VII secretion target [Angustibacter sp.]